MSGLGPEQRELVLATAHQIRLDALEMVHQAGCGHPGGPLGMAEMLAVLYRTQMRFDPAQPDEMGRDRFVLSNGHTCAGLYSILSQVGFFDRTMLRSFRKLGSPLQGHPHRGSLPGVDMSTGSLGTGLSVAAGMALAAKADGRDLRVYASTSDGENQEGQPWEMATSAVHYDLDNLCLMLDWNGIQIDGNTSDVMDAGDLRAKWEAFGWHALEIDGHDVDALYAAFEEAKAEKGRPSILCCRTSIGKGVSFMEDTSAFHGCAPDDEQYETALAELTAAAP